MTTENDSPITWDHPSELVAHFAIESELPVEEARAVLRTAAAERRYWEPHGINALGALRLEGEVGMSSFDLTVAPYVVPHFRARAPKLQVAGDIQSIGSGSQLAVTVVCSSWLSGPSRAQFAADVRTFLTDILAGSAASPDIQ
jgi:hypothetical protein